MPDITMCSGVKCLKKEKCWRFTATPGYRQSMFAYPPMRIMEKDKQVCDYFWDNSQKSNKVTK